MTGRTDTMELFEKSEGQLSFLPVEEQPDKEAEHIMEAVLFALPRAVEVPELARACDCPVAAARKVIEGLKKRYDEADGALLIRELDGRYQMCTSPKYFEHLVRVVSHPKKPELSEVLLETLAIIANKNPATRVEIEKIRGVKSDFAVNKLIEYGLIEEAGRLNAPGKPILLKPTDEFYRRFGVENAASIPQPGPEMESRIEDEVEIEVREQLGPEEAPSGSGLPVSADAGAAATAERDEDKEHGKDDTDQISL